MSGQQNIDSPSAFSFGVILTWQRIILFFAAWWLATVVGGFFVSIGEGVEAYEGMRSEIIDHMTQGTPVRSVNLLEVIRDVASSFLEQVTWSPLLTVGYIFMSLKKTAWAVLVLPALGASFLIILYSELEYWRGVALLLVFVPANVLLANDGRLITWLLLLGYMGALGYYSWRLARLRDFGSS